MATTVKTLMPGANRTATTQEIAAAQAPKSAQQYPTGAGYTLADGTALTPSGNGSYRDPRGNSYVELVQASYDDSGSFVGRIASLGFVPGHS